MTTFYKKCILDNMFIFISSVQIVIIIISITFAIFHLITFYYFIQITLFILICNCFIHVLIIQHNTYTYTHSIAYDTYFTHITVLLNLIMLSLYYTAYYNHSTRASQYLLYIYMIYYMLICGCLLIKVLRNVKKYKGTTNIEMVGEHCSCKALSFVITNKEEIYNREIIYQVVMMVLPGFVSGCLHCLCMVYKDIWDTWSEWVECVGYVMCYVSVWSNYYAFYWTIRKEYDERECKEGEHEVEEKGNDNIWLKSIRKCNLRS